MTKVMYLHGLEGSPYGTKASYLRQRYTLVAPELPAYGKDVKQFGKLIESLNKCVPVARKAIERDNPDIIVASSFGGAVLMRLYAEQSWQKPAVFLAQGAVFLQVGNQLPADARAIFIHGREDSLIPLSHSQQICEQAGPNVELWVVDDDHYLYKAMQDGIIEKAVEQLLAYKN